MDRWCNERRDGEKTNKESDVFESAQNATVLPRKPRPNMLPYILQCDDGMHHLLKQDKAMPRLRLLTKPWLNA